MAYIGCPPPYRDSSEGQLCFLEPEVFFRDEFSGQLGRREDFLHLKLYLGKTYVVWLVDLMSVSLPPAVYKGTGSVVKLTVRRTSRPYSSSTLEQICGSVHTYTLPYLTVFPRWIAESFLVAIHSREFLSGDTFQRVS